MQDKTLAKGNKHGEKEGEKGVGCFYGSAAADVFTMLHWTEPVDPTTSRIALLCESSWVCGCVS